LVKNGKLKTTLAKAKFVQGRLDKLVTLAKRGDLASIRRLVASLANDKETAKRFVMLAKSFKRNSGYTRIVNYPQRRGDATKVAQLEWVDEIVEVKKQVPSKQKSKVKKEKVKKAPAKTVSKTKGESKTTKKK
jgi:large subunit ribosomal protein L17